MKKRKAAARRPKDHPGTFLRIPLEDGSFGYGRLLEWGVVALYDHKTARPSVDLKVIGSKRVLFSVAVSAAGVKKWKAIGQQPLAGEVAKPVVHFMQDIGDYRRCTIFDSVGMEEKVGPDACIGLERAAVWEAHHVAERLLDTFMGRPNISDLSQRVRLHDRYREYRRAAELPGWTFEIEEIAADTYRFRAFDQSGRSLEGTGAHAGAAFDEGKRLAAKLTRRRGGSDDA